MTTTLVNSVYYTLFVLTSAITNVTSLYYPNIRFSLTFNGWFESLILLLKNEVDRIQVLVLQTLVFSDSLITNFRNGTNLVLHYLSTNHLGTFSRTLSNVVEVSGLSQTSSLTPLVAAGFKVNYDATFGYVSDLISGSYSALVQYTTT